MMMTTMMETKKKSLILARTNKCAVIIHDYKLPTYRKNFDDAGFVWDEVRFLPSVTLMKVHFADENFETLQILIRTSDDQATRENN